MGMEDLVTGIVFKYDVRGIDVLGKATGAMDKATIAANELTGSLTGLKGAFAEMFAPMSAATAGMRDFTTATGAASRAARGMGSSTAAGIREAGAATRQAKAEWNDLHASIVAATQASSGFGGFGGSTRARAGAQSVLGPGSGIASSWFGNRYGAPGAYTGATSLTGGFGGPAQATATGVQSLAIGTVGSGMRNVTPGGGFGGGSGSGAGASVFGGGGGSGVPRGPSGVGGFGFGAGGALGHSAAHGAVLGAEILAGYGVDALVEAGKLQSILVSTQNITGANRSQMARARAADFNVGDITGMSAVQTADMFRELSRQSQGSMSFNNMLGMLPQMAKMQVVLGNARGFSPHQTTDAVMALTHLFRQYDPNGQKAMFNTILKMGELMPDNLGRAVTQMTYMEPTLKNLHVPDADAAALMVAMSRFGMGRGKGGTSVQNLFAEAVGPLQMTAHAQAGKARLLGPSELNVLDAQGHSRYFTDKGGDPVGFINALYHFSQTHGSLEAGKVIQGAFGKTGARMGDMFTDPVIIKQYENIRDAIVNQKSLGLDSQVTSIFGTANQARKRFDADFQSTATQLGSLAIPAATKALNDMAGGLHNATSWLIANKDLQVKVQHDLLGAVKGTEQWITGHRQDWIDLRHDLSGAYGAAKQLGPVLGTIADGLLAIGNEARFVNGIVNGNNPIGWAAKFANPTGTLIGEGRDLFSYLHAHGINRPGGARPGTMAPVNVTINVPQGPHARATVQAVMHAIKGQNGSSTGTVQTGARQPAALTVPKR